MPETSGKRSRVEEQSGAFGRTKPVVDVDVDVSALVADSRTRAPSVAPDPDLPGVGFVHGEVENDTELIVDESGKTPERVARFVDRSTSGAVDSFDAG